MDVEKTATGLKDCAEKMGHIVDGTNMVLTEMRLQQDTLIQSQQEERIRMQELYSGERDKIRKHYGRIILALVLTIVLILGSIVGAVIYVLNRFEISDIPIGYTQNAYNEVGGDNIINDGIHFTYESDMNGN